MSTEASELPRRAGVQIALHRDPSAALGTLTLLSALAFVAYRSPQPWTAAGLVCFTATACFATPELMRGALEAASSPLIHRLTPAIGWVAHIAVRVLISVMVVLGVFLAIAGTPRSQAITVSLFLLIVFWAVKFFAWQMRYLIGDLVGGGHFDREVARRWSHLRWPLAGTFFVAGTLLQLAGTFSG